MGNWEMEFKGIEIDCFFVRRVWKFLKDIIYFKGIIKYFVVFKINYLYVKLKF